jgi:hypothetical protein
VPSENVDLAAGRAFPARPWSEQARGLGSENDFVFTSSTGRPLGRERLSERGVTKAAEKAGLGHVTAQTLRRSVATAPAHAKLPVVIAAATTGDSKQVYDAHYAKPFRDAEERENVRRSLALIGFGNTSVDQKLTNGLPRPLRRRRRQREGPAMRGGSSMGGAGLEPAATCV